MSIASSLTQTQTTRFTASTLNLSRAHQAKAYEIRRTEAFEQAELAAFRRTLRTETSRTGVHMPVASPASFFRSRLRPLIGFALVAATLTGAFSVAAMAWPTDITPAVKVFVGR